MKKDKHVKIHDKILIHTQNGNTCPEIIIHVSKVLKIYCKANEQPRGRSLLGNIRQPRDPCSISSLTWTFASVSKKVGTSGADVATGGLGSLKSLKRAPRNVKKRAESEA